MICALYSSPMSRKKRIASSRLLTERVTGICSLTIFSISAWIGVEVVRRERALVGEVVVEAVVDHRTDGHLRAWEEALHGLAEQVRRGVAEDVQRLGALLGDDLEGRVVVDGEAGIDELAVDLAGERGLGEAGADRSGDVLHGDGMVERALAAVG